MLPHRKRRPDFTDDTSFTWRLFKMFGVAFDLCVVFYSDDREDDRPADRSVLLVLLKGVCQYNRTWLDSPDVLIERAGKRCNLQLFPAQSYEETLFSLPWMEQADMKYDTDRRAWFLVVSRA